MFQDLPDSQHPEVFGMHENVDISKDLQQTKLLFDCLLLTHGGGAKGAASSGSDNVLYDITNDILTKVESKVLHLAILSSATGRGPDKAISVGPTATDCFEIVRSC